MSNQPIDKWQMNGIQIAAWKGDKGISYSIQKRFKDATSGEWKETKYFYPSDLATLAALAPIAIAASLKRQEATAQISAQIPPVASAPKTQALPFEDDDIPF